MRSRICDFVALWILEMIPYENEPTQPWVRNKMRSNYTRLSYAYATVSIISLYFTITNHLFTNTYRIEFRIDSPMLYLEK